MSERTVREVGLFWQGERESPGDPGWAYRVRYSDGHEESGGLDVPGDEGASLSTVRESFALVYGPLVTLGDDRAWHLRWEASQLGGWVGRPR